MRRVTIADIARAAGVSKGSVSYALNDKPGVSDATRRRILEIADELRWAPSTAARSLSDGRADAFGLVIDRPARALGLEPFFMQLISGIQGALSGSSTSLMLQVTEDTERELDTYRMWFAQRRVDGVLVVDLRVDDPRPELLSQMGLPAVLIGGPLTGVSQPYVWSDDASAVREVVHYLFALRHRRIGRVAGPAKFLHTQTRSEAFSSVTSELGLMGCPTVHTDYSDDAGARATRRLLADPNPPSALLFDNDLMAVAALGVAQEMGISVPEQLSVVAFDDSPLSRSVRPALTAVRRDAAAHGQRAAEVLQRLCAGEDPGSVETPPAELVPRSSTAIVPDPAAG
ncbi:LacI family DNA-binding transcriptional regulator [Lipingzhangella sp. LS1_29]|uniref:LacI family DNA-binding transcriptional regulator n=1 Tax=Lipingzhangella rawalii TaxID=2055835 RepID=A0ABU2H499_9ACTN|nr:LacI family DNA-binding transcriptional regulator [Lipingzhangella rawalii]MDS1270133.1 LacI family DNA-binding transcriptional regulator [Lipingzhangella rawalii]